MSIRKRPLPGWLRSTDGCTVKTDGYAMDALLPAFIAALLAEIDGRVQRETEILCAHFKTPGPILSALGLSTLASLIAAGIGGFLVAPLITYEARTLLLGLALLITGVTTLLPTKTATAPKAGSSAFLSSLLRYATRQFGDNSQFLVFAIAARSGGPSLAVIAGFAGVMLAALPVIMNPSGWRRALPLRALRWGASTLLLLVGVGAALSGLRLI
jgi:Ca2+/H+ antiporter, TMEM165/GDT1 family